MLQPERSSDKYVKILQQALPELQERGFHDIRASLPDYEKPSGFKLKGADAEYFTPDISAKRGDSKAYIDIASRKADKEKLVSKWKLLSKLARMRRGFFGIITPKGTVMATRKMIQDYQLNATLIRI